MSMKLTPIEKVKAGDAFRSRTGRIFKAGEMEGRCDGCAFSPLGCRNLCVDIVPRVIAAELPTVRVLAETATYFRDRLAREVVAAEINGGRAKPDVYEMLAELEGVVGKAEVRL